MQHVPQGIARLEQAGALDHDEGPRPADVQPRRGPPRPPFPADADQPQRRRRARSSLSQRPSGLSGTSDDVLMSSCLRVSRRFSGPVNMGKVRSRSRSRINESSWRFGGQCSEVNRPCAPDRAR